MLTAYLKGGQAKKSLISNIDHSSSSCPLILKYDDVFHELCSFIDEKLIFEQEQKEGKCSLTFHGTYLRHLNC